jgi:hypothetical protein
MKTAPNLRTIQSFLKPLEPNLNYPIGPIAEDMLQELNTALEAADSDEVEQSLMTDWLDARPHLKAVAVLVPEDMQETAFGPKCTLAAQGELVRRYGEQAAEVIAARWKTKLGSVKPGIDPKGGIPGNNGEQKKRDETGRNPWSTKMQFKTEEARRFAQASFIRAAGTKAAVAMARAAGVTLGGSPLKQ